MNDISIIIKVTNFNTLFYEQCLKFKRKKAYRDKIRNYYTFTFYLIHLSNPKHSNKLFQMICLIFSKEFDTFTKICGLFLIIISRQKLAPPYCIIFYNLFKLTNNFVCSRCYQKCATNA